VFVSVFWAATHPKAAADCRFFGIWGRRRGLRLGVGMFLGGTVAKTGDEKPRAQTPGFHFPTDRRHHFVSDSPLVGGDEFFFCFFFANQGNQAGGGGRKTASKVCWPVSSFLVGRPHWPHGFRARAKNFRFHGFAGGFPGCGSGKKADYPESAAFIAGKQKTILPPGRWGGIAHHGAAGRFLIRF